MLILSPKDWEKLDEKLSKLVFFDLSRNCDNDKLVQYLGYGLFALNKQGSYDFTHIAQIKKTLHEIFSNMPFVKRDQFVAITFTLYPNLTAIFEGKDASRILLNFEFLVE